MGKKNTMQTNAHNTCQHAHNVYIHTTVGTCMAVKIHNTCVALCLKLKAVTRLHYCSNWQRLPLSQKADSLEWGGACYIVDMLEII